jgi:spermidine synthase
MNLLKKWAHSYLWFIFPENILFKGKGLYSEIKVTRKGNLTTLYTGDNLYEQSSYNKYAHLSGNWAEMFLITPWFIEGFNYELDSLLILGLGGGSQVKLFNKYYTVNKIKGVEIDPLIIEIARNHFDLNDANLEILNTDAYKYLMEVRDKFTCILVDAYKENIAESQMEDFIYLQRIKEVLEENGVVIFNKSKSDGNKELFLKRVTEIFGGYYEVYGRFNTYIIAINSTNRRYSTYDIKNKLTNVGRENMKLKFFKKIEFGS